MNVAANGTSEQNAGSSTRQRLAVLCADDHTLVGDALAAVFSTAGYTVERVNSGDEAWSKLATDSQQFDVVIADHELPGLNALQLIGRMRDSQFTGRMIVHARELPDEDMALYQRMGVEAIVSKNADPQRLLGIVKAFHRQD
jgi:DNA-binding response OmpR family regulator